jgi:hypothetical protein
MLRNRVSFREQLRAPFYPTMESREAASKNARSSAQLQRFFAILGEMELFTRRKRFFA